MLNSRKIGRPAGGVAEFKKDSWKFITIKTSNRGGANSSSQTVFSKITFADPVVRVSSDSEYWFEWRYNRRMKFNDTNGAMEFELAQNGAASHWDRTLVNNGINRCAGGQAAILGKGVAPLIHIEPGETDGRCRINSYRNVDIGTTVCQDIGSHLFKVLLNGEVENIDLDGLDATYGTVTVKVKDL